MQQSDKSIILLLPFIIYLFSFLTLLYNENFYNSLFIQTNVDIAKAQSLTKELFAYFKSNNYSIPAIKTLTENENRHIRDVKLLLAASVLLFCFLLVVGVIRLSRTIKRRKTILCGCLLSMILPLLFLIINFSYLFTVFHLLFFPQGNWLFPVGTMLVSSYTSEFFRLFAVKIFFRGELISVFVLIISFVTQLYSQQQQNI